MKSSKKITIICLSFLLTMNFLNAQSCTMSSSDIQMQFVSKTVTSTKVYTTLKVTTSYPVNSISVGNNTCTGNVTKCTGTFTSARECTTFTYANLKCYVKRNAGCIAKQDGCVVVIGGRDCGSSSPGEQ